MDDSRYNPAIDPAFSSWSNYYWSGSTCAGLPTIAWEVTFDYGSVNLTVKSHTAGVRCVRGGPGGSLGHLDITEPDGDEVLVKGQEYTITWDRPNITGDIQIDLYKGGTEPQFMVVQLAAAAPNTGQYEFFIPDYLVGGTDYRIGISAQNGQVWNFSSMNFTITPFKVTLQSDISDAEITTGDAITYRICVANPENVPISDIEIRNPIPQGTTFESATGPFSLLEAEGEVRWDIGVLAPGAISCVDLTVIVNAPPGAQVSNSVSVHSGVYVATRPPYLTDITENTVLGLALTVDTISLSTPVVLEEFGSLEVGG